MLQYETPKLFYDKYPYKLVIRNSLAIIFREKNFNFAKEVLDDLQHQFEKGEPLIRKSVYRQFSIDNNEFFECQRLYKEFRSTSHSYRIRVENPKIQIYSDNKNWLIGLAEKCTDPREFWAPTVNELIPNTILVDKPVTHEYKVTLSDRKVDPGFIIWIEKNPDKIKIGNTCKNAIQNNMYCTNYYFYIRDERVLNLVKLIIGASIRRIDRMICKQDIDK